MPDGPEPSSVREAVTQDADLADPPEPLEQQPDEPDAKVAADDVDAGEGLAEITEISQLDLKTLAGDVSAAMLEVFKARPKPWGALLPGAQRDVAAALDDAAETLVRRACWLIAKAGRPTIDAKLESFNTKDGIKITLTAGASPEALTALLGALGKSVAITAPNFEDAMGRRREVQIDDDQHSLPLGGEDSDGDLVNTRDFAPGDDEGSALTVRDGETGELVEDEEEDENED